MDPFSYGIVVEGEEFCPRPELAEVLCRHIKRCQNAALIGERRMGKTSLVVNVLRSLSKSSHIYVDLLEIKSVEDFVSRMVKALILFRTEQGLLTKVLETLRMLRPSVSVDPISGMPTVSIDSRMSSRPESLESVLDVLRDFGQKEPLVVVLDEFQDVLNLRDSAQVIALLRSKIQFMKKVTFLFSGSVRSKMEEIFISPESPLFKSTSRLYVGPIERTEFTAFLKSKFEKAQRKINKEALDRVFSFASDNPGDVQELCSALWSITKAKDRITVDLVPKALELIFARELKSYEMIMHSLSSQQAKVLAALANLGGEAVTGKQFIERCGILQPSSIKKAMKGLVEKLVVLRRGKEYCFVNPFFAAWLRSKGYF